MTTIAPMQRETLATVLDRAAGVERDAEVYRRQEGHELTLYLGQPGRAMVVSHVESVALLDGHVEIEAKDRGTLYADYDTIHALLDRQGDDKKKHSRGTVGFG